MSPVAVVTGAAGGVGSATCDVLEGYGWEVVPVDRLPSDRPGAIEVDIANSDAVMSSLGALERVDALVNNAALQLFKPILETTVAEWDEVAAVNIRGSVVNVSSVHSTATSDSIAAYAATKGGLTAFTRAAAVEMAPFGVRVNAVLPGAVDTPALRAGFARRADAERILIDRTPLKRLGTAREIGEMIAFLLAPEKAAFITGQTFVVDGGALAQLSTE